MAAVNFPQDCLATPLNAGTGFRDIASAPMSTSQAKYRNYASTSLVAGHSPLHPPRENRHLGRKTHGGRDFWVISETEDADRRMDLWIHLRLIHDINPPNQDKLDLSLGQELAGGGFAGKQAKLGKLILEGEGLLMMDLLVAANMGLWFRAYEKVV